MLSVHALSASIEPLQPYLAPTPLAVAISPPARRGCAALPTMPAPRVSVSGYNWHMPLVSQAVSVPIRVQTEIIHDSHCGTSGGVMIHLATVEVVHRLQRSEVHNVLRTYGVEYAKTWINEPMHSEINQLCSQYTLQEILVEKFEQFDEILMKKMQEMLTDWAPGIEVIAVRITKPKIPMVIQRNFDRVEDERSRLLVVTQHQFNELKQAETERRSAVMEAEKLLEVASINSTRRISQVASRQEIASIEDAMIVERAKVHGDSLHYKILSAAESEKNLLSPAFLQFARAQHTYKNTKVYFGDAVPDAIIEEPRRESMAQRDTALHSAVEQYNHQR